MTITVHVRAEGLSNITRRQFLQGQWSPVRTELAAAINRMGDQIVNHLAYDVGLNLNMTPENVRTEMAIRRADRGRLEYVIDGRALAARVSSPGSGRRIPYTPGQRTFGSPAQPERFLRAGQLARIRTQRDDDVCPICAKLAEGTYPIEEARTLLPAHPNCRCTVEPVDGPQFQADSPNPTMTTPSGARPERGNPNIDMDEYLRYLTFDVRAAMERAVLRVV